MSNQSAKESDSPALRPLLPLLLVLFFGSGCAALIYEIVWFQLLQLVIGSSAVSLGVLLGTYMGGMCLGSRCFLADRFPTAPSAAGLRAAGIGNRAAWNFDFVWIAASRLDLFGPCRQRAGGNFVARIVRRRLPAAADRFDGRDAAGDCALGRDHAARHFVARIFLRRQHRRRRVRLPAGGILFVARP